MAIVTESPAETTTRENAERGFVAPDQLRDSLQRILVDLVDLQHVGKQAHWNIVGPNFRDLHLNLDEIVAIARTGADDIAERMRALHTVPDARIATVAKSTSLPTIPEGEILTTDAVDHIVKALEAVVTTIRDVHDPVDEADPTTADLLHEYLTQLEQQVWFISAETRTPKK